jgi:hypothetical protein
MHALLKNILATAFLLMVIAALGGFLFCRHYHVYSVNGWQVYQAMGRECHPSWEVFNFGRVRVGDDVDDVIARTNPVTLERKGHWVILKYQTPGNFTGMTAVAYDGKMVFALAWSCSWNRLFFDELT